MLQVQTGKCLTKEELILIKNKFLHRYEEPVAEEQFAVADRDLKKFYKDNIPSHRLDFVSLNKNKYPTVRKKSLEK